MGRPPIKVETEFIIRQRIMPSLALAGATIDDIIHAQVYLTDPEDYSAFNETWSRHFAKTRPSLSIIPIAAHGLASYDGTIEINVLAAKPGSAAQKRHVDAGVPTAFRHQPQAVKAGDLLFMSAQIGDDSDGRLIAAAKDARQPGSARGRKSRPSTSSTTSRSFAKPQARRCITSSAFCNSIPTSTNSIRSIRSGSAASAAGRCRSPR